MAGRAVVFGRTHVSGNRHRDGWPLGRICHTVFVKQVRLVTIAGLRQDSHSWNPANLQYYPGRDPFARKLFHVDSSVGQPGQTGSPSSLLLYARAFEPVDIRHRLGRDIDFGCVPSVPITVTES